MATRVMRRARQALLAEPLEAATLSISAVDQVLSSRSSVVVGVGKAGFVLALQRYESPRQRCSGRRARVARVQVLRCVGCTWCKRMT